MTSSHEWTVFATIMVSFVVLCVLSRTAVDRSPQGQFGASAVKSTAVGLLREAERARLASTQDGWAAVALSHAIEARVLAQTSRQLAMLHSLGEPLAYEAMDVVLGAQIQEDAMLEHLNAVCPV